MNPKFKLLLGTILAIGAFCLFEAIPPAQAQPSPSTYQTGAPNFYRDDTNACPAPGLTLTNSQLVTFPANGTNSLKQTIRQDHGLSVFVTVVSSNNCTTGPGSPGLGYLGWDVSSDGANYTTKQPLIFEFPTAAPVTGTLTTNVYWTNWSAAIVNNFRSIQLTVASNSLVGTAGATVGNTNSVRYSIRYSYSVAPP